MSSIEETVRRRAYQLWEQAGQPEGRSEEFWFAARAELENAARTAGKKEPDAPAPRPEATSAPPPAKPAGKGGSPARPAAKPKAKKT